MSKSSEDLEKAIANAAKIGSSLPQNIPKWMQRLNIVSKDVITESTKIGNNNPNNKTDILIKFQISPPLKISAKLSNAAYFGNWYGHERFISEFGRKVFDKLTLKTSLWANEWANRSNANLFVGVSISFGERTGKTYIPFLDIFDSLEDLTKIVCGVGDQDNVANCLYVSDDHPKSIEEIIEKLSPINLSKIQELSEDIKIIFRPINPFTEGSNRGKNVYTKFEPNQSLLEIEDVITMQDLMKLGKFTTVFPNKLNHNHILDTLQAEYNIRILRKLESNKSRSNPTTKWQFYSEHKA